MGDNESYQRKRKFKIKLQNENHWLLHKVRQVPRLSRNLILVGKLSDEDSIVTYNDKILKFSKSSLVVEKGVKVGILGPVWLLA